MPFIIQDRAIFRSSVGSLDTGISGCTDIPIDPAINILPLDGTKKEKPPCLGVLRDFIASFHNVFIDPPVEVRLLFNELEQMKYLLAEAKGASRNSQRDNAPCEYGRRRSESLYTAEDDQGQDRSHHGLCKFQNHCELKSQVFRQQYV